MQVSLEAIKFNHDQSSATGDAFNIRRNEDDLEPFPEWKPKPDPDPFHNDSRAAYAIEQTSGHPISIKAKFICSDPNATIEVKAVDAQPAVPNVLGRVEKAIVTFGANGESDFVPFLLQDVRLSTVGVGINTIVWSWKFRVPPGTDWIPLVETAHKIYSVIDLPQPPWSQDTTSGDNTQLPWTDVLDVACDWAASAQNVDQATEKITREVNNLGRGLVIYQPGPATYALANFDCTNFLKLLSRQTAMCHCLNCSDCATIVSSFANILGCKTREVYFPSAFDTNPIILIGKTSPAPDHFENHEVAWNGISGSVFDACLQLNQSPGGKFQALLPANLPFSLRVGLSYKPLLDPDFKIEPQLPGKNRKIGVKVPAVFTELDPQFVELLKNRYQFDTWPSSLHPGTPPWRGLQETQLPAPYRWERLDEQSQTFMDGTKLRTVLLAVTGTDLVFREDLFECSDEDAARELLLRLLAEYKSIKVERIEEPSFADFAFIASDKASVVFANGQSVVLLRLGGRERSPSKEAGSRLHELLGRYGF